MQILFENWTSLPANPVTHQLIHSPELKLILLLLVADLADLSTEQQLLELSVRVKHLREVAHGDHAQQRLLVNVPCLEGQQSVREIHYCQTILYKSGTPVIPTTMVPLNKRDDIHPSETTIPSSIVCSL